MIRVLRVSLPGAIPGVHDTPKTNERTDRRTMKTRKRILSVKIKRMVDTDPDTSYLGKYSDKPASEFSIDRAHAEDCSAIEANHRATVDALERIIGHLDKIRTSPDVADNPDSTEWESLDEAIDLLISLQSNAMECDCSGGSIGRHEYRYFNPATVESFKADATWNPPTIADLKEREAYWRTAMRSNAKQDYERMESYNAGQWCYIGIGAEAEVITNVENEGTKQWHGVVQRVHSGGLWGIESDSESSYLESVERENWQTSKRNCLPSDSHGGPLLPHLRTLRRSQNESDTGRALSVFRLHTNCV